MASRMLRFRLHLRHKRFETHSREDSTNNFESLNHEISEVVKQRYSKASKYLLAKLSYYLTHCMIRDVYGGVEPQNVIRQYFAGSLDRQQYAKIISTLQKPAKETAEIPIVSTIEGIKGQDGDKCLFILTTDLAPYLFRENTTENRTKNKLYVALTRSLNSLTILITLEVDRLLQIMCKPPEWCKIEASHRRFYYGQKESHAGRKGPAGENPRTAADGEYRQHG